MGLNDVHSLSHSKWNCKYHIVFAPKYRRRVFYGEKRNAIGKFDSLGINMTTAINIFLRQSVRNQGIPFPITANNDYKNIPAFKGAASKYANYDEYVAASLKEADMKVAEGTMKYYTADEIRSKLEAVLNETV